MEKWGRMANRYAVIDFETTGLSPQNGDRITEVAIVMVESGMVVDQFQSLVKTEAYIPREVELLTGISNQMMVQAPDASKVVPDIYRFIGDAQLVAHNASFDSKFFKSELERMGLSYGNDFICTLLLSRRLYQHSSNLKLQTLANYHGLNNHGNSHRALADALVTTELFARIENDLKRHYSLSSIGPQKILRSQKEALKNFAYFSHVIHQEKAVLNMKANKPLIVRGVNDGVSDRGGLQSFQSTKMTTQPTKKESPIDQRPTSKKQSDAWYMPFIYLAVGIFGIAIVARFPVTLIPLIAIGWVLTR